MRVREHGRAWEGRAGRSRSWAGRLSENLSAEHVEDASVVTRTLQPGQIVGVDVVDQKTCWLVPGGTKFTKVDLNQAGSWFL